MKSKRVIGTILILVGAVFIPAGILLDASSDSVPEGIGDLVICLGCLFVTGGVVLVLRRDVTLIPWPIESTPAIRCIVGGIGIIVMSFFPLELAVRDPHYRWLAGGTFIGAFLTGVLFLWAGWKFARKVRE